MAALPEAAWAEVAMEVGLEVADSAAAVMAEGAGAKGEGKSTRSSRGIAVQSS